MKKIIFILIMIVITVRILNAGTYSGPKVAAIIPADSKGEIYNNQMFNFSGATQWNSGNGANAIADTNVTGLVEDKDSSAVDGTGAYANGRFADGNNYFIYKLSGPKTNLFRADLRIGNNFKVGLMRSTTGAFEDVLNSQNIFNDDVYDLQNMMYQTIDVNYYLQTTGGTVYLKVVDGSTADGWGGKCGALWFRKIPEYQNGDTIKFKVYTDKSNHTVSADFSGLGGAVVYSGNNGQNTNIYPIEFTIPQNFSGHNVLYEIPVTVYNGTYNPASYTAKYLVYINNPVVGYITNNRYEKDYIYGWNGGESGISLYETSALYDNSGSAINGDNERYADANNYFTYKFSNVEYDLSKFKIEDSQNYRIYVSKDNSSWVELANSTNEWGYQGGNNEINKWEREYYIRDYLGTGTGDVYLKFADLSTSDGWGGVCSYVKLLKVPVYKRGENITIKFKTKFNSNISAVTADFGAIDSNGGTVTATKTGDYYSLNYTISANNTKSGLFSLPIKMTLNSGGYRYFYYKIGINYIEPNITFSSISLETNNAVFYLKKLTDWSSIKVYYSSNARLSYTNMTYLTITVNNSFGMELQLDEPYYFGIKGKDSNSIESSDAYYLSAVKINENSEDEYYFYGNNSTIKILNSSIYGDTILYFNEESEDLPAGISGIKYYRVQVYNQYNNKFQKPYILKLHYNNDVDDNKNLSIYHLDGSQWKRLVTKKDTTGAGGYVIANTTAEGWFVIAESQNSEEKNYVEASGFSPDGDGINDYYRFIIPVADESKVSVEIYNLKGKLVKFLQPETVVKAPGIDVQWDGTTDSGDKAPIGVYIYKVKVGDNVTKGVFVLKR